MIGAEYQLENNLFKNPELLGLRPVFEMTTVPIGKTFFYRNEHKQIIETKTIDELRLKKIDGPLLYAVTDYAGVMRYIGKWETATPLYARWFRHNHLHHQASSRNLFISEIKNERTPLIVWSANASEIKSKMKFSASTQIPDKEFVKNLEALWISRWRGQLLWNKQTPTVSPSFDDGEYWKT